MSNVHIRFNTEDIDHYEPSDSENELSEQEDLLLKKNYKQTNTQLDSEDEVFGLDNDDDLSIANSDIEGQEDDDDLPNIRAWGKSKRNFYSTDYVDQDYGGYDGKDAQAAEFEEEEAKAIQIRLAEQLNDEDFMLNLFDKETIKSTASEPNEEVIKSDLSTLTKRELIQLLEKESPELIFLTKDCKTKLYELKSYLYPLINNIPNGLSENSEAIHFIRTLYDLILNYSTNVYMYLLLKASKENVQKHPVLKRLYQYRKLIAQLETIYTDIIKPQIEIILNKGEDNSQIKYSKDRVKKLLTNIVKEKSEHDTNEIEEVTTVQDNSTDIMDVDEVTEHAKRAITYQIAKNKGLMSHRKKEQRNPRVKHRNKFRKANICRKGAVREVRKELKRYDGEMSGIKTSVSKSIKLK